MNTKTMKHYKLWLNKRWYLSVDEYGYLVGEYAEGALGCVIQIKQEGERRARVHNRALKIPRLLADTSRENAFICHMLLAERKVVWEMTSLDESDTRLVKGEGNGGFVLYGQRNLVRLDDTSRAQNNGVILVSFEKDRPPRFCCVKFTTADDENSASFYPPLLEKQFKGYFKKRSNLESLRDASAPEIGPDKDLPFHDTAFLVPGDDEPVLSQGRLTYSIDDTKQIWYAALPSIEFRWAQGTFQEAVDRSKHAKWSITQTYDFLKHVLRGVNALHSEGFIHGDIRPANILAFGSLENVSSYYLGDFGSFNSTGHFGKGPINPPRTGNTLTGPVVGNHRASIFYSPERRKGIEKESADVAIILSSPEYPNEYFVCLGWRNVLLNESNSIENRMHVGTATRARLEEMWKELSKLSDESYSGPIERLCSGDRIRLRDYIFTVEDSRRMEFVGQEGQESDFVLCLRCERRVWRVLHEKISICDPEEDALPDGSIIILARYTELRRWTAATDLYGLGALALYSVFTQESQFLESQDVNETTTALNSPQAETQLMQMTEIMESIPYFWALWGELEFFRKSLEGQHASGMPQEVDPLAKVEIKFPHDDNKTRKTLEKLAEDAVKRLIETIPNLTEIYSKFENTADFILFIHFVMSCLHRRSHLNSAHGTSVMSEGPFCANRLEEPDSGAARLALERLDKLLLWKIQRRHAGFERVAIDNSEINLHHGVAGAMMRFYNASEQLRMTTSDLQAAREEEASAKAERDQFRAKLRETHKRLESAEQEFSESREEAETTRQELERVNARLSTCEAKLAEAEAQVVRAREALSGAMRSHDESQAEIYKLTSHIEDLEESLRKTEERLSSEQVKKDEYHKMSGRLHELRSALERNQVEKDSALRQLEGVQSSSKRLQETVSELSNQAVNSKAELEQARAENAKANREVERLRQVASTVGTEHVARLEQHLKKANSALSKAEGDRAIATNRAEKLQAELTRLKNRLKRQESTSVTERSASREELGRVHKQYEEKLKQQAAQQQQQNAQLQQQNAQLQQQIEAQQSSTKEQTRRKTKLLMDAEDVIRDSSGRSGIFKNRSGKATVELYDIIKSYALETV